MTARDLKKLLSETPVTDYVDYRDALTAMFQALRGVMSGASWLDLAETLGFSRTNVLWLAATRRRKLTALTSRRIADTLGWQGLTRRYWLQMVEANNTRDPIKRDLAMGKLMDLKASSIPDGPDALAMEYFSEWFHPVIRELTRIRELTAAPEAVTGELLPRVLPAEAQTSFALLQRLGLITIDEKTGKMSYQGENVLPSRRVARHASIRFHHAMMDLAKEAIVNVRRDRREFNGLTVGLSASAVEQARQIIRKACEDVMALESDNEGTKHLYQMNIQLFPFTKE